MLVDQVQILANKIPGRIEKIIYEIQARAAHGLHSWNSIVFSGEDEIVRYFTEEGFDVKVRKDLYSNGILIAIS